MIGTRTRTSATLANLIIVFHLLFRKHR